MPSPTKDAKIIEIKIFNWTIPDPKTEKENIFKKIFKFWIFEIIQLMLNFHIKFNDFKLINSNESWIAPATIKDQASAKWALDLNKNMANIMQVFKITDKKEGIKNFPFIFKIELKIAESVTKIKKGKVIVNNWPAKMNWSLL